MSYKTIIVSPLLSTVTVENTTTETELWCGQVDADSLKIGSRLEFDASGDIDSASAADVVTIRIKVAGVTVVTLDSEAKLISGEHWHMEAKATQRTLGASGGRASHVDLEIADISTEFNGVGTIDTTTSMDVTITAQWNNAKAGNILTATQAVMKIFNRW